jgi:hypothetical protein
MSVKELIVKPIDASSARRLVTRWHYSGKFVPNSFLHLGVFLNDKCGGVMQFGTSMDKRKTVRLVPGTAWNGFLELNRMAFAEWLPRNSESRSIAVAMRLIRKHYPHIEWVVSYADASQCGDGTIYRASGFVLTQIKKNTSMYRLPDGSVHCKIVFEPSFSPRKSNKDGGVKAKYGKMGGETSGKFLKRIGAEPIPGFQLRYLYFLSDAARQRYDGAILPFSEIAKAGAKMYRGKTDKSVSGVVATQPPCQAGEGGAEPTDTLQTVQEISDASKKEAE